MNKLTKILLVLAAAVFVAGGVDYMRLRSAVQQLSAEHGRESIGANVAHSTTLITGGHTDATTSTSGFQSAADKLLWTQWQAGPTNYTFDTDDFRSGGLGSSGSATIANNTTATFGQLNWRAVGSGTAAIVSLVTTGQNASHTGIVQIETGSQSTGIGAIVRGAASTPNFTLGSGVVAHQHWWTQIPTLSDGTNTYTTNWGWTTGAAAAVDGCFATYGSAAPASGTIICRTCASSSCTTGTGGAPPTVVGGTWYRVDVDWDGTNCSCKVDGTNIGSTASTIPTAALVAGAVILKSAGGTTKTALVDYYSETNTWAANR